MRGNRDYYWNRAEWIESILLDTEMSPAFRLVAIAFALFTDPKSGWCCEGQSEIARLLGIARMTVIRAKDELEHIPSGLNRGIPPEG
jgi:hypothetical protein